jgi:circadian clock protein KaiC
MKHRKTTRKGEGPADKPALGKCPTGITGFDSITYGGLPRGRATLVCGAAGSGKTLFGMQVLVNGALEFGEPGVFLAFEESPSELARNVASLGFDLDKLVRRKLLSIDSVVLERSEIEESGEYDLEGLFLRLGLAIDSVKAKRVVIDTLENLFGGLSNYAILRSELARLFRWLKQKGVTAVVTAEKGEGALTRHGLEEYVSDCVIVLDHRVQDEVSTRRLRVVKYRGSFHGTNEYPFLIDEKGISIVPITGAGLDYEVSEERVSTGVPRIDSMLEGKGYYRGSTILVSGTAGTGKTSLGAHFADAICRRGERCLFLSFEESPAQLRRNMRSVGIDLARHVNKGVLSFLSSRPSTHGLETHLAVIHKAIDEFAPSGVVVDPVSNFTSSAQDANSGLMMVRLIDLLKSRGITAFMTTLTKGGEDIEQSQMNISSIVDTWILLKAIEANGERNRGIYILKSRGMDHSNQIREFLLTSRGIELVDVSTTADGVLTGSAGLAQEAREAAAKVSRDQEIARQVAETERKRKQMEQQIASIRNEFRAQESKVSELMETARSAEEVLVRDRIALGRLRGKDRAARMNSGKNANRSD